MTLFILLLFWPIKLFTFFLPYLFELNIVKGKQSSDFDIDTKEFNDQSRSKIFLKFRVEINAAAGAGAPV